MPGERMRLRVHPRGQGGGPGGRPTWTTAPWWSSRGAGGTGRRGGGGGGHLGVAEPVRQDDLHPAGVVRCGERPSRGPGLVVAAAGYGTRLELGLPKQYVPLLGIPMLQRTLDTLATCPAVDALVVVVNEPDIEYCAVRDRPGAHREGGRGRGRRRRAGAVGAQRAGRPRRSRHLGPGGRARRRPAAGDLRRHHPDVVARLAADDGWRARCWASPPPTPSRWSTKTGWWSPTPRRAGRVWRAQTPQIFRWEALLDAYAQTPTTSCCAPPTTPRWWRPGAAGCHGQGLARELQDHRPGGPAPRRADPRGAKT